MRIKKLIMTGLLTSLVVLGACEQSSEDTAGELEQEEVEQAEDRGSSEDPMETDENESEESTEDEEAADTTEESGPDQSNEDESTENQDSIDAADNDGIELDMEEDILEPTSTAVLVNKEYSLPEDYAPSDLVTVDVPTVLPNPEIKQMRQVAADALKEMFDAAEEEGIFLYARSGYRSYETQIQLFQNYASNHGEAAANKYSARAGESEHQTGLVMDVTSESVNLQITSDFGETEEGRWVNENGHKYGFIIRYPEGKSDITGYIYEPWHIRYLGDELALDVYESGLTYEEYLADRGLDIEIE